MERDKRLIPEDLLYDSNNCWVKVTGDEAVIGFTEYGLSIIGDIIYLELPLPGTSVRRGEELGSIESGKWVGKMSLPVTGVVVETNRDAEAGPYKVNKDPYSEGWILRVKLDDSAELEQLMDAASYREWIEEQIRREQEEEAAI